MAKTKKYSLPYWVKAHTRFKSQPEMTEFLPAIKTYVEHYENGGHPELVFTGPPLELANDLYLEWKRRGKDVWAGLFPTPLWLSRDAARLLNIQPGQKILDPGCGFGNLMWAARQCGAEKTVGIELQGWVVEWGKALGFDVRQGDFIGNEYSPPCAVPEFDAAICNPPYGKMFGSGDIALGFMARIASISKAGTRVAAILPQDYMTKTRPKKLVEMAQRFEILQAREIAAGAFSPLTPVATTLYLLKVIEDGPEAIARVSSAVQATEPVVVKASTDTRCHIQLTHEGAPLCGTPLPATVINLETSEHPAIACHTAVTGAAMCPDCQRAWIDTHPSEATVAIHLALTEGQDNVPQGLLDLFAIASVEQGRAVARLMSTAEFAKLLTDGLPQPVIDQLKASANKPQSIEAAQVKRAAGTLQAWEMTRAEWAQWNLEQYRAGNNGRNPAHDSAWRQMTDEEAIEFYSRSHIHFVRQAIEQGKPVPLQVLADCSELTQPKDVINVPRALFKRAAANVRSDLLATRTGGYPLTFDGKLWLCVGEDNPAALPACRKARRSCEACQQSCMARADSAPAQVYMMRVACPYEWQGETINRRMDEGESPAGLVIHGGNASAPSWVVTGEEATWQPDDSLDRLDSIVKQEHARRAAEVAIVGGHRILFIGAGNMYDAERLAAWVEKHQTDADALGYCPCGNFGILGQCHCEKSQVDRWLKQEVEPRVDEADIVIEVHPVDTPDLRQGETDEIVWHRVLAARQRFSELDPKLDGQAFRLLAQAKRQMGLDKKAAERITRVAQSIALLSGSKEINAAHVAEAIQYWPRPKAASALSTDPEQPPASVQTQVVTPEPVRKPALPEGVPPIIEIDLGRVAGWAKVEVTRVDTRFLYCQVNGTTRKFPLAGHGMVWRAPVV